MEEKNLFEGIRVELLEEALSILYSTDKIKVKVKLIPKEKYKQEKSKSVEKSCKTKSK